MASIDQQFVEFIVKSLVGNPDAVKIERRIDEKGVLLELTVDPEDLGRVIGKRGATAQSIRSLLRALGTKNDARYNLKIVDNGVGSNGGGYNRPSNRDDRDDRNGRDDRDDHSYRDDRSADKDDSSVVDNQKSDDSEDSNVVADESGHDDDEEVVTELTDDEELPTKSSHSNVVSNTRKELEELDDLDV
jgi:predicted RNA-binding protein YlqC (UPF0109 family)